MPPVALLVASLLVFVLPASAPLVERSIAPPTPPSMPPGAVPHPGTPPGPEVTTSHLYDRVRVSVASNLPEPAGSWPTYESGGNRSGHNFGEYTLSPKVAANLSIVWNVSLPGPIFASPSVVNGTVFVGSWDGNETALYASNGTVIWNSFLGQENFTGQSYGCPWANPLGVTSAAALYNNRVFVGGATSYYALNQTTGAKIWSYAIGSASSGYYDWSSPLFYNGSVYVGIASQCDNPLVDGGLDELSASTGKLVHHLDLGSGYGSSVWSSPTIDPATNTLWVTTGNGNYGSGSYGQAIVEINATTLTVQGSWQAPSGPNDIDFGDGATLFNYSNGQHGLVATNKDGWAYALNRSKVSAGAIWSDQTTKFPGDPSCQPPGLAIAPATYDGSYVYLPSGFTKVNGTNVSGAVRAAYPSNGTYRWQTAAHGAIRGGLVSANGLVVDVSQSVAPLATGGGCYSFSAFNQSWLQVLDAGTGRTLSSISVPYVFSVAPAIADGRIFAGAATADESEWTALPNHRGHLYAFGVPLNGSLSVQPSGPTLSNGSHPVQLAVNLSGGMPGYSCQWLDGSAPLGAGCRLNVSLIPGVHGLEAFVRDAANETWNSSTSVTIPTVPLNVTMSAAPPSVENGSSVRLTVDVVGGQGPYDYAYTNLPSGCDLQNVSTQLCVTSGPGNFSVSVRVLDVYGDHGQANTSVMVYPSPSGPPPTISGFSAVPAVLEVGGAIAISGQVDGGALPVQESLLGLPPGCGDVGSLNLTCSPSSAGSFTITGRVVDSLNRSDEANASVTVFATVTITGFSVTPPSAQVGRTVEFVVDVGGGVPPYTTAFSGLPPGCSPANVTILTCAPLTSGTSTVVVVVTDSLGYVSSDSVVLQVSPAATGTTPGTAAGGPFSPMWLALALGSAIIAGALVVVLVLRRR